jgi:hypothetical protein
MQELYRRKSLETEKGTYILVGFPMRRIACQDILEIILFIFNHIIFSRFHISAYRILSDTDTTAVLEYR